MPASHTEETVVFMLCERCGAVDELADAGVARRLDKLSRDHGFRSAKRTVEIRGSCGDCARLAS